MTAAPQIDVRDLNSVRRAADRLRRLGGGKDPREGGDVLLGEDIVLPEAAEQDIQARRRRRGVLALNRSPLARKIVTFNLIGLAILLTGMLYFAPSRDSLAFQRAAGLVSEAALVANVVEARLPLGAPVNLATGDGVDPIAALSDLDLQRGVEVFLFDGAGRLIASREGVAGASIEGLRYESRNTWILDALNAAWDGIAGLFSRAAPPPGIEGRAAAAAEIATRALAAGPQVSAANRTDGDAAFLASAPIIHNGAAVGAIALSSAPGEIDLLVRAEREQMLKMFGVGILVSIALSLLLASTIANPIADLAAAAELGRDRNARKMSPDRIRIPDLSHRPDEIGRLSAAMRGMVAALYERIESNEQFAADVAHEIKNPLASLRSAVGTMRIAKRDDQREKLLDIIEHDTVRLDRLVTDISTASRLDADLVKEEEETFDLLKMLGRLAKHHATEAAGKGIDFIADLPPQPVLIQGLEGRLAQVFVNLITNAISFCETGDAIRIWARKRGNRVLIVVEDTGPGIPEDALAKIFQRFYSERPPEHFGNNSGLGLAISKQIVEAHGGVIWAENIRPTEADTASEPLGARFVVGLPV